MLLAVLEPTGALWRMRLYCNFTSRLAMVEENKPLSMGAVWDYHCLSQNVFVGMT